MNEEWADVPGTDGMYQASTIGRIRSRKKGHTRILKTKLNSSTGYEYIILHLPSGPKTVSVHRMVAMSFIDNPCNLPEVNHINEIKTDNAVGNLEWVSAHVNNEHSKWKRQKPIDMFSVEGDYLATFAGGATAAELLGLDKSQICRVLKNEGTTCNGFIFRYRKERFNEYPGIDSRRAG